MLKKLKKIFLYAILIIVVAKCFQIVFFNKAMPTSGEDEKGIAVYKKFNYGDYTTIKLLHTETGEVEELPLDIYLYGVVSAEMPASFEDEALKAQAVVARTYTIYKIRNGSKHVDVGADICDNSLCCQAWISKENRLARWEENSRDVNWAKIENSVNSTIGNVVLYNGEPINSFFHSNSGGTTESSLNVWGGDYPYLQVVATNGEDAYTSYKSEVNLSKDELIQKMHDKYENFEIDFSSEEAIKILENTESGRVKTLKVGNTNISGVDARNIFELKSTKFTVELKDENIKFSVLGYGHGVGLSQCGSDSLAKDGKDYKEIIKYYYKDVEISE
ncbi:MAG: stage II sporulation protein D [Clostridia bacterium]|nr:stage II sporulation protein D [Clostridia bacterium]